MARKKKRESNIVGWIILGAIGFGIFQFGILQNADSPSVASARPATSAATTKPAPAAPLNVPRYVSVASLNVRHTPSTSGPLIGTLAQGTALKVLDRQNGWLLIDLSTTLEGWVSERLTTTEKPSQRLVPPAALRGDR